MSRTISPVVAPPDPLLESLPRRVGRKTAAEVVSRYFFPTTQRAMERWPVDWIVVNGKAVCDTSALLAFARGKVEAARPPVRAA